MKTRVLKIKYVGLKVDIEEEVTALKERQNVISQSPFIPNQSGDGLVCFVDILMGEMIA